jgi:hypothetical protein
LHVQVVVQRPMSAAVASRCCLRRFQQLAVARGTARCLLHVLGLSAKADACGRSFAVLSTQVISWLAPAAQQADVWNQACSEPRRCRSMIRTTR